MMKSPPKDSEWKLLVELLLRAASVILAFALAIIFGRRFMLGLGDMRGSILPLYVVPGLFAALWILFTVVLVGALVVRDGSQISVLRCAGYAMLMSVVAGSIILAALPHYGSYGPGP